MWESATNYNMLNARRAPQFLSFFFERSIIAIRGKMDSQTMEKEKRPASCFRKSSLEILKAGLHFV